MLTGSPKRRFEIHALKHDANPGLRVWENDPDTLSGKYVTDVVTPQQAQIYLSARRITNALTQHQQGYATRLLNDWWSEQSVKREPGIVSAPDQRFSKPDPNARHTTETRVMIAQTAIKAYEDYLADGGDPTKTLALVYKSGGRFTVEIE